MKVTDAISSLCPPHYYPIKTLWQTNFWGGNVVPCSCQVSIHSCTMAWIELITKGNCYINLCRATGILSVLRSGSWIQHRSRTQDRALLPRPNGFSQGCSVMPSKEHRWKPMHGARAHCTACGRPAMCLTCAESIFRASTGCGHHPEDEEWRELGSSRPACPGLGCNRPVLPRDHFSPALFEWAGPEKPLSPSSMDLRSPCLLLPCWCQFRTHLRSWHFSGSLGWVVIGSDWCLTLPRIFVRVKKCVTCSVKINK